MNKNALVQTISNVSFAGQAKKKVLDSSEGIMIKPSETSNVTIWIPYEEIEKIFIADGVIEKEVYFGK